MSRLSWRQRLIAVAIGMAAAALQASTPSPTKVVHAAAAPAQCAAPATDRC